MPDITIGTISADPTFRPEPRKVRELSRKKHMRLYGQTSRIATTDALTALADKFNKPDTSVKTDKPVKVPNTVIPALTAPKVTNTVNWEKQDDIVMNRPIVSKKNNGGKKDKSGKKR